MSRALLLFILGAVGIAFYATAPIFFPDVPNLRQPELLPIYSLMLGLGGILHKSDKDPPTGGPSAEDIALTDEEARRNAAKKAAK